MLHNFKINPQSIKLATYKTPRTWESLSKTGSKIHTNSFIPIRLFLKNWLKPLSKRFSWDKCLNTTDQTNQHQSRMFTKLLHQTWTSKFSKTTWIILYLNTAITALHANLSAPWLVTWMTSLRQFQSDKVIFYRYKGFDIHVMNCHKNRVKGQVYSPYTPNMNYFKNEWKHAGPVRIGLETIKYGGLEGLYNFCIITNMLKTIDSKKFTDAIESAKGWNKSEFLW